MGSWYVGVCKGKTEGMGELIVGQRCCERCRKYFVYGWSGREPFWQDLHSCAIAAYRSWIEGQTCRLREAIRLWLKMREQSLGIEL